MYAIIRRYTPDVVEGQMNECFADLSGLRTFFKMTYNEIAEQILKDLYTEIGIRFVVKVSKVNDFEKAVRSSKKSKQVSTYKEINKLFAGMSFLSTKNRKSINVRKIKLTVPFIGRTL